MRILILLLSGSALLSALLLASSRRSRVPALAAALLFSVFAAGAFAVSRSSIPEGGELLVYGIRPSESSQGAPNEAPEQLLQRTAAVVKKRLDGLGRDGNEVEVRGRSIEVRVPGSLESLEEVKGALAVQGHLDFTMVDDDANFFEPLSKGEDVPRFLRFQLENAPLGPGKYGARTYAFMSAAEHEAASETLARLQKWTSTLEVPPNRTITFEKVVQYDEDSQEFSFDGYRTFLVHRDAEITGDMIQKAHADPDRSNGGLGGWLVNIEFTSEGGQRFEDITASNTKRRFAIVLDGIVMSAPVIMSKIAGGHAVITMGAGNVDDQARNARELAAVLGSTALPAPLELQAEDGIEAKLTPSQLTALTLAAALALTLVLALLIRDMIRRDAKS